MGVSASARCVIPTCDRWIIPDWERGFYESAFTHANVGRLTRHEGGFEGLWSNLADKRRPFPVETSDPVAADTGAVRARREGVVCASSTLPSRPAPVGLSVFW